ncbi:sodium:calcium antiporter [Candidatus Mycoplasma mahonii]|uniref:sodium:calcium antiporter n=1 Tax=Candidatus Mycoplasma mahonii TaxID=3004105 RepID=UPI0026ED7255|nr:hypothetical protein [Candidatus Mycoplasma mahonii]WKX02500.1 hypothetical protein O3I44_00245 [Candidatus Mycoplasma mahonii]
MLPIIIWINSWTSGGTYSILLFIPFVSLLLWGSLKLVKYSEAIIKNTRYGGAFVGGVLLAAVTSMPELITEIAQSSAGYPGAGVADDIGSNAFSGFLIAISLSIFYKTAFASTLDKFSKATLLISSLASFVLSLLLFINKDISIGNHLIIGIIPLCFFLFYLITLILQYKFDKHVGQVVLDKKVKKENIKKVICLFIVFSLIIILLSLLVNWTATSMILRWGLKEEGVGGILLAITTSFPEIIAFIILFRHNQKPAAIAALVGSHFFNIGISFFGDLSYSDGATFANKGVGNNWPIALIAGIIMFLIFLQSIFHKYNNNLFSIALPSLAVSTYIIGWTLILVL